ncbi:MAG: 5-formyltetrahydrofolate cyclo-ligase [Candidatus Omnitrophota bacterium]
MAISGEKKELRAKLLAKLLSLTAEELKRRSDNVTERLSNLPLYKKAKVIMAYFPLKGEVDILRMIRKDLKSKRFCFPVMDVAKKELQAFQVSNLEDDFAVGPFGVRQPLSSRTRKVTTSEIDMIIVPALAFDREKNRLGRGAGFYDRFLKNIHPPTSKVGIAFDFQICDDLPIHPPFDEKVDLIVSEHFTI